MEWEREREERGFLLLRDGHKGYELQLNLKSGKAKRYKVVHQDGTSALMLHRAHL